MKSRLGAVALECLFDLGVTIVYAVVVGILIAAIVVSDDGPISILRAGLYAAVLPAAVIALILAEIGTRSAREWWSAPFPEAVPVRRSR